jgi:hypothetical protein
MDGRAVLVDGFGLGVGADQPVEVARLELVSVACHGLQVADAVMGGAGGEDVVEGERREGGVAAGAAAADREPSRVDIAARDEELSARDAVVDIVDAPSVTEGLAVGAAVAGAATVVDVEDSEPRLVQ